MSCFVPLIIIVGTLRICEGNYGYGNFGKNQVQSKINLQLEGDANKKVVSWCKNFMFHVSNVDKSGKTPSRSYP